MCSLLVGPFTEGEAVAASEGWSLPKRNKARGRRRTFNRTPKASPHLNWERKQWEHLDLVLCRRDCP